MLIIVIYLLIKKKFLSLKPTIKMLSFQFSFVSEAYLMNLDSREVSLEDTFEDNHRKNNLLVLGECPTFGINRSFGSPVKKFSINFSKANTMFF